MPQRYQQGSFSWTLTYCSSRLHLWTSRDVQDATAKGGRLSVCRFSASSAPALRVECFLHSQETKCHLLSPSSFPISISSFSLSLFHPVRAKDVLCHWAISPASFILFLWNFSNFAPHKRQNTCLFLKPSPTLMFQTTFFHSFNNNFQMY